MKHRFSVSPVVLTLAVTFVVAAGADRTTQAQTADAKPKTAARMGTPAGRPDLHGVWNFSTVTPMERPAELAGKAILTDEEAAYYAKREADYRNRPNPKNAAEVKDVPGFGADSEAPLAYEFRIWWDRGTIAKTRRTSLVVDPPDGRIPSLTPEAQKRQADVSARRKLHPADGPEDRTVTDRCILGLSAGPPMIPNTYNNNVRIFQTSDYVVLVNEMFGARIVPMDGRPHVSRNIRQWSGDSRGRWEGNSLVVDTTNFYATTSLRGSNPNVHLIERFTRTDRETLIYEFTVDDRTTWTQPWSVEIPMTKTDDPIYEYACHEGNYSMFGILSGARAAER